MTVRVDPERLREAAQRLRTLRDSLEFEADEHATNLGLLADGWRDKEFELFAERDREAVARIRRTVEELDTLTAFLIRKAELAEDIHHDNY